MNQEEPGPIRETLATAAFVLLIYMLTLGT